MMGKKKKYVKLFIIFPVSSTQKNVVGVSGILAICVSLGA